MAVDNEAHYGDMYDPTKSSSFARELSFNLKEVAKVLTEVIINNVVFDTICISSMFIIVRKYIECQ